MVSRIPNGCKKGDAILEDEHTGSTGEKQEKNRSIGSAISICFQFYNEVVASIEGIKCKYNRHSTSARFGAEIDYIMRLVPPMVPRFRLRASCLSSTFNVLNCQTTMDELML